mmetsp:Transcript_46900/g.124644  ORF Transcript_46900/g.124644 Transcript_46900/m.124644 type:complete len:126 (-) Transcript_46900:121-498(-)
MNSPFSFLLIIPFPIGYVLKKICDFLFLPPVLYILVALVVLSIIYRVLMAYKDVLTPYLYPVFDFIATLGRGTIALGSGIKWIARHGVYPVKEGVFLVFDKVDHFCSPWKSKNVRGRVDVPTFQF